ncbi:MAG TPA: hypothetical protein VE093_12750 [Polyangiaceae bacterium]|jgi:hypothetical protein|nr:hypothetical protein [Polyangiaceae bacterium]
MAANFHYDLTIMAGADLHSIIMLIPAPPGFLNVPTIPHVVGAMFFWPSNDKRTPKVTTAGQPMIKGGHSLALVPHVPLDPRAYTHALEIPWIALVILGSSSKAQLSVHKVTGQGAPMATAILWAIGLNVNCNSFVTADALSFPLPTGRTLSLTTVQTSPTLGDYLGAIAGWLIDAVISFFIDKYVRIYANAKVKGVLVRQILRTLIKAAIKYFPKLVPIFKYVTNPGENLVQPWIQSHL